MSASFGMQTRRLAWSSNLWRASFGISRCVRVSSEVMGTQAFICHQSGHLVTGVFVHHDGDALLDVLAKHYFSVAELQPLLGLGDLLELRSTPEASIACCRDRGERPSIPRSCSIEQALAMGEHCYVLRDYGGVSTWTQYRCRPALGVPWNRLRDAGVELA